MSINRSSIVINLIAVLFLLSTLSACVSAVDVKARYPGSPEQPAGTVFVDFPVDAGNVKVSVNGQLVAESEMTRHVEVRGVPAGKADVVVVAGGGAHEAVRYSEQVELVPGGEQTVLVIAPEVSLGYWLWDGISYVGLTLMYAAWVLAVF